MPSAIGTFRADRLTGELRAPAIQTTIEEQACFSGNAILKADIRRGGDEKASRSLASNWLPVKDLASFPRFLTTRNPNPFSLPEKLPKLL